MAKSKKKYYVVWSGVEPGIYEDWEKTKEQITGFPGAKFKAYGSRDEAEEAYYEGYQKPNNKKKKSIPAKLPEAVKLPSLAVDAACSGNPGALEYRGVWTDSQQEIFHQGPFEEGTNNIGEFLALVHALAYIQKNEMPSYLIYSDSKIAMGWLLKKKCNTKLKRTAANQVLFTLIERAENWLKNNSYDSVIVKWETKEWGEIPADFGRK